MLSFVNKEFRSFSVEVLPIVARSATPILIDLTQDDLSRSRTPGQI